MSVLRISISFLFCTLIAGTASALSVMPVTGGDPFPMVFATVSIVVLIIGSYVIASWIARRKIDGLRRKGDIEGLVSALKNPLLAGKAAKALGEINDERAVEPLIEALHDRNEDVRCLAAKSLGEIGDPRAEDPLENASHDEYRQVRDSATGAIRHIHKSE